MAFIVQERMEDGDEVEMQVSDDEDGKEVSRRERSRHRPQAHVDDDQEEPVRRPAEKQRDDERTRESRDNIQVWNHFVSGQRC